MTKQWTATTLQFLASDDDIRTYQVDSQIHQGDSLLRTLIWVYFYVPYVPEPLALPLTPVPPIWYLRSTNGDSDEGSTPPDHAQDTSRYELIATGMGAWRYAGSQFIEDWQTDTTTKLPVGSGETGTVEPLHFQEKWQLTAESFVDSSAQRRFDLDRPEFEFGVGVLQFESPINFSSETVQGRAYIRQLWEKR